MRETTRLAYIRHGESKSNAEGWLSGPATCGGLTDKGRAEAEALRDRLLHSRELDVDVVLVSTMRRAIETAEILQPAFGEAELRQVHDLCERFPGECEGMSREDYLATYGREAYVDPVPPISPGGESLVEFLERVRRVGEATAQEHVGRTVVLVCHGGVVLGSIAAFLGVNPRDSLGRWAGPANTALTVWSRREGEPPSPWCLERFNDHAHLAHVPEHLR